MFQHLQSLAARSHPPLTPAAWQDPEAGGSARHALLDGFLLAGHGRLEELGKLHQRALETDSLFYGPLSRWYAEHGNKYVDIKGRAGPGGQGRRAADRGAGACDG